MNSRILLLICLICVSLFVFSCTQQQVSQEELLETFDTLENRIEWLEYRMALESWQYYSTGEADSLDFYEARYNDLVQDQNLLNLLQTGKNLLTEEIDQRRRQIFLSSLLWGRVETDADVAALRDSLSEVDRKFKTVFEGQSRSRGYLHTTYRFDENRLRRESAYRSWCAVGDEVSEGIGRLIRMRNQRARRLGYNNFMALVFSTTGLSVEKYRLLIDRLDSLSEESYLDILDRVGAKLNLEELEYWDLSYGYADINGTVDRYFPADSQLPYIRRSLKALDFNLDKLPIYFDLEAREGKSQYTFSLPVKPPHDVRVMGNQSDGMYSTMVLLHEIGHAVHFVSVAQDRDMFARNIDGSWTEGMAQIMASLLDEKEWLTTYAKLPEQLADSYLSSLDEQKIIRLRVRLLILAFEYEAYTNPNRDLNKMYWDLQEHFLHLPRHEDIKPWAAIMHLTRIPVYLQNYLYADVIAAQTYNFLKQNYGSPVDNPRVSAFLIQNYYRFGGRYDWHELLERGTDEELNPDYLIKSLGI